MFQTSASGLLWEVQLHVEQSRLLSVGHLNDEMKRKREMSLYVKMNRRFRPISSVHASLGLFHIDVTSLFMCFSLVCLRVRVREQPGAASFSVASFIIFVSL